LTPLALEKTSKQINNARKTNLEAGFCLFLFLFARYFPQCKKANKAI